MFDGDMETVIAPRLFGVMPICSARSVGDQSMATASLPTAHVRLIGRSLVARLAVTRRTEDRIDFDGWASYADGSGSAVAPVLVSVPIRCDDSTVVESLGAGASLISTEAIDTLAIERGGRIDVVALQPAEFIRAEIDGAGGQDVPGLLEAVGRIMAAAPPSARLGQFIRSAATTCGEGRACWVRLDLDGVAPQCAVSCENRDLRGSPI